MKIVLFLGYSGAGKTTAISTVTRAFTERKKKVGTLKHAHDPNFTMDTKGKDTWKYARSGASVIVGIGDGEISIIKKGDTSSVTTDQLISIFEGEGVDYLLVEGLYRKFESARDITRVLCAGTTEEALDLLKQHVRPACIVARRGMGRSIRDVGIPVVRLPRDTEKLLSLIG